MEIELNGAKLRVYECGKIEKFGKRSYKSNEKTWFQLKGHINITSKSNYQCHRIVINGKSFSRIKCLTST